MTIDLGLTNTNALREDLDAYLKAKENIEDYARVYGRKIADLACPINGVYLGVDHVYVSQDYVNMHIHFTGDQVKLETDRKGVPDHPCMGCFPVCIPTKKMQEVLQGEGTS
jgi:hypothetical protein